MMENDKVNTGEEEEEECLSADAVYSSDSESSGDQVVVVSQDQSNVNTSQDESSVVSPDQETTESNKKQEETETRDKGSAEETSSTSGSTSASVLGTLKSSLGWLSWTSHDSDSASGTPTSNPGK